MTLTGQDKLTLMKTHDDSKPACAYRLKIARIAAGLEPVHLAREAGVTISTYSHQESGRVFPSKQVMRSLYKGYGIDYNFFFEGDFNHLPAELQSRLFAAAADIANSPGQSSD